MRDRRLHRNNEYTEQMSKFIAGNKVQDHRDVTQKQSFTCFTYLDTIERNESVQKIYWVSQKLLRYSKRFFQSLRNRKLRIKYQPFLVQHYKNKMACLAASTMFFVNGSLDLARSFSCAMIL